MAVYYSVGVDSGVAYTLAIVVWRVTSNVLF